MKFVLVVLAIALCMQVSSALKCYECESDTGENCNSNSVTCATDHDQYCFKYVGTSFLEKGCLETCTDGHTETVQYNGVSHSVTVHCCHGDNCNGSNNIVHSNILVGFFLAVTGFIIYAKL